MDAERLRDFLLKLPHVEETMQWGDNLVYWVGDKAIGGKMFAVVNLEANQNRFMSFYASPEHYAELLENQGVFPAPYAARLFWVALERPETLSDRELRELLERAHSLMEAGLPQRTRDVLAMPAAERKKLVVERRKLLASRAKAKSAKPKPAAITKSPKRKSKP
jgi:predicted DNA-binding protein (MmcQ/YjbR family)